MFSAIWVPQSYLVHVDCRYIALKFKILLSYTNKQQFNYITEKSLLSSLYFMVQVHQIYQQYMV